MIQGGELFKRIGIGFLTFDHLFRRVTEWEEDIKKAQTFFGRRKGDKIMDFSTILTDAKLAEALAPELKAVFVSLEALYTKYKTLETPPAQPSTPA
jgi:hypothetical protein